MLNREEPRTTATYSTLLADYRLLLIVLLTSTGALANTAVPVALPYISESLLVSDSQIGLVMTVYFVASGTTLFFVGTLADMFGRRTVVLPSLLVFGVASTAVLFVDSFVVLLGLRMLQGAAFPAITPLSTALIGDIYSGPAGTTAQGMKSSAAGIAGLLGPVLAGLLAVLGWQYPFLLGALAFPTFLLVYRFLPESSPRFTEATTRSVRQRFGTHLRQTRREFGDGSLKLLFLIAMLGFGLRNAYVTFLPLFAARELGAGAVAIGILLAIVSAGKIPVAPLAGRVVAYASRRLALIAVFSVIAGAAIVLPFAPTIVVVGLLVATHSLADGLFTPILNDSVVSIADDDRRSSVVTVNSIFKNIGSATAPAAFGLVLAFSGFTWVFFLIGCMGILGVLLCVNSLELDIAMEP